MRSGRNAVGASVSRSMGCCLSGVPFRISLTQMCTMTDVMDRVRIQQRECLPHELVGHRKIFSKCTDWPLPTTFTSVINHQQVNLQSMLIGETVFTPVTLSYGEQRGTFDILVGSFQHVDCIEFGLSYAIDSISPAVAEKLFGWLCRVMDIAVDSPGSSITEIQTEIRSSSITAHRS
nr:nonribosomal peptide synthetase easa [Quercus suber]